MVLNNLTKGSVLANDLQYLNSWWGKTCGLLSKYQSRSLYFQTRFGIHTFGLKLPIDVVILNQKFRVMKLATVQPNRLFFWNPKFDKVIELKNGSINRSRTKLNDLLELFLKNGSILGVVELNVNLKYN